MGGARRGDPRASQGKRCKSRYTKGLHQNKHRTNKKTPRAARKPFDIKGLGDLRCSLGIR